MFKNKKSIFLSIFGLLTAMAFIPSFTKSNVTLNTSNDKLINTNDDEYHVMWENDGTLGEPNWGGSYRFSYEGGVGEERCLAMFTPEEWDVIKTKTFYLDLVSREYYPVIRVDSGWWTSPWRSETILPYDPLYEDILFNTGDNQWTLKIDFTNASILDVIDQQNLMFTGERYTPIKLYYGSLPDPKDGWENKTREPITNWGGTFRFSNVEHITGEQIYAFPMDTWNRMKSEPFYIDVLCDPSDINTNIRITTGWWDQTWPEGDYNHTQDLIPNEDGTYKLEIDFNRGGVPHVILDVLDEHHLLFTGSDYTLLKIYFDDSVFPHCINNKRKENTSHRNNAYLSTDKTAAGKGDTVTVKVNKKKEFEFAIDDLLVTYNDGSEIKNCDLTQIDETTFTFVMPDYDVDINATFDADYLISFDTYGHGGTIEPQLLHLGSKVEKPIPSEFGWTFDAWYREDTSTYAWDFENDTVSQNITLFAKWEEDTVKEIVMKSNPDKTEFDIYQDLDLTGAKITATTASGITQDIDITSDMVSGFKKGELGEQTITVTYTYKGEGDPIKLTTTFKVKVVPHTVHSLTKINGQAPTLFEPGWKDYYECPICKKLFADVEARKEIINLEVWKIEDGKIAQPPLGEVIGFGTAIIFSTIAIGLTIYYIVLRKKEIVVR